MKIACLLIFIGSCLNFFQAFYEHGKVWDNILIIPILFIFASLYVLIFEIRTSQGAGTSLGFSLKELFLQGDLERIEMIKNIKMEGTYCNNAIVGKGLFNGGKCYTVLDGGSSLKPNINGTFNDKMHCNQLLDLFKSKGGAVFQGKTPSLGCLRVMSRFGTTKFKIYDDIGNKQCFYEINGHSGHVNVSENDVYEVGVLNKNNFFFKHKTSECDLGFNFDIQDIDTSSLFIDRNLNLGKISINMSEGLLNLEYHGVKNTLKIKYDKVLINSLFVLNFIYMLEKWNENIGVGILTLNSIVNLGVNGNTIAHCYSILELFELSKACVLSVKYVKYGFYTVEGENENNKIMYLNNVYSITAGLLRKLTNESCVKGLLSYININELKSVYGLQFFNSILAKNNASKVSSLLGHDMKWKPHKVRKMVFDLNVLFEHSKIYRDDRILSKKMKMSTVCRKVISKMESPDKEIEIMIPNYEITDSNILTEKNRMNQICKLISERLKNDAPVSLINNSKEKQSAIKKHFLNRLIKSSDYKSSEKIKNQNLNIYNGVLRRSYLEVLISDWGRNCVSEQVLFTASKFICKRLELKVDLRDKTKKAMLNSNNKLDLGSKNGLKKLNKKVNDKTNFINESIYNVLKPSYLLKKKFSNEVQRKIKKEKNENEIRDIGANLEECVDVESCSKLYLKYVDLYGRAKSEQKMKEAMAIKENEMAIKNEELRLRAEREKKNAEEKSELMRVNLLISKQKREELAKNMEDPAWQRAELIRRSKLKYNQKS